MELSILISWIPHESTDNKSYVKNNHISFADNISVLFRLQRVKTRAHALMQKREQPDPIDVETIRAALQA